MFPNQHELKRFAQCKVLVVKVLVDESQADTIHNHIRWTIQGFGGKVKNCKSEIRDLNTEVFSHVQS